MSDGNQPTDTSGLRSYFSATSAFDQGTDNPSAFLERCLEEIETRDTAIGAFVAVDADAARREAEASTKRWRAGQPWSAIDGMPIGIKDIMETAVMVTEQGSPLFAGWVGGRDGAAVVALREAGAVIVGKTVTTEFAASHPAGTRNPHDPERTPGGSSSGSAAAVGAGMLPAALGSQVIGSIIRPASYCGVYGYKPSVGGINRGGSFDRLSQSCTGVLGASLRETWTVAREISARAGGDPGHVGILGPLELPSARKPSAVALIETQGRANASEEAWAAILETRERLEKADVRVLDRHNSETVSAVEDAIADALDLSMKINAWEGRWPLNTYSRDRNPALMSESARERLVQAEAMTQDEYRDRIAQREHVRAIYARLLDEVDVCITLAAPAAAPVGLEWTGDPAFTVHTSLIGMPAVTMPVLEDRGLPLGLQISGFLNEDAALMAIAGGILALY